MESAQQLFGTAVELESAGDLRGARVVYGKAIDTEDDEYAPAAAVRLGGLLETLGDLAGARSAYRAAADSGHPLYSRVAARKLGGSALPRIAAVPPTLLEPVANPDLYRRNAFRLSGLPVDATPRELRRRGEQLRAAERLGAPVAVTAGPLPPVREPEPAEVREALNLVRDPTRRIVEEFFWFWQRNNEDARDSGLALHDAAVLAHAQALDSGHDADLALWRRAYEYWNAVLDETECWQWVAHRVAGLDDRRLSEQTVETIRAELPRAVLAPQATLTVRAAEAGEEDAARIHLESLRRSGFAAETINEALAAATKHLSARIRASCQHAEQATAAEPEDGAEAVDTLMDQVEPLLHALGTALGKDSAAFEASADAVALAVNSCVIRYVNEGHDFDDAFDQLEEILEIAVSRQARAAIEPSFLAAGSNVLGVRCESAAARAHSHPGEGAQIARELLAELRPVLITLSEQVDTENPHYHQCLDGVALCLVSCLGSYHGATGDDEATLAGLDDALSIAFGDEARAAIEQSITVVQGGFGSECWFCDRQASESAVHEVALFGEVDHSNLPRVTWKTATIPVPRCGACRAEYEKRHWLESGLVSAPILLLGLPALFFGVGYLITLDFGVITVLLFLFGCMFLLLMLYGGVISARQRKVNERQGRANARLAEFPPIQQLESLGWRLGARPPGL